MKFKKFVYGTLLLFSRNRESHLQEDHIPAPKLAFSENNSCYLFFPIIVEISQAALQTVVAALHAASLFKHDPPQEKILLPENFDQEDTVHICNANQTNEQIIQTMEVKNGETVCMTRFSNYVQITTAVSPEKSEKSKKIFACINASISFIKIILLFYIRSGLAIITSDERKSFVLKEFQSFLIIESFIREITNKISHILETKWGIINAVMCACLGLIGVITVYKIIFICMLKLDPQRFVVTHSGPGKNRKKKDSQSVTFVLQTLELSF
jgi:hypothetical protein